MIYTSYFAAMRRMTNEQKSRCICIALWPPKGVNIPTYSNLAPTKKILLDYKKNPDTKKYIQNYCFHVLSRIDPHEVYEYLDNKILLCYEKPEDFCHRHIVADWFKAYGHECEELKI